MSQLQRRLVLDLFCGEGGASVGLHRSGFDVIGCDIKRYPRYPFPFVQADATRPPFDLSRFDLIWASPPCEGFTIIWRGREHMRDNYPDLLTPTRKMLVDSGAKLFVLENVPGAPIRADTVLSGAMFGLLVVRKRLFETHGFRCPFTLAPEHNPEFGNTRNGGLAMVAGRGGAQKGWNRKNWLNPETLRRLGKRNSVGGWREAMDMPWASRDGIRKAIPPAYSEFIGRAALAALEAAEQKGLG